MWLIFSFLTLAIGYHLGKRKALKNIDSLIDQMTELQDHLEDVKDLGFSELERVLEMELSPAINDLMKMIEENELSSEDDDEQPQTPNTESRDQ